MTALRFAGTIALVSLVGLLVLASTAQVVRPASADSVAASPLSTQAQAGTSDLIYQWTNVTGSSGPSSRIGAMMAYDATDGYVLLFGGENTTSHVFLDDTWTYHAGVWTNITSTAGTPPPARDNGAMTWDAYDGYVLLYGGYSSSSDTWLSDTWSFVGGVWTELFPTTSPGYNGQVYGVEMTYDAADQCVVFYGGSGSSATTWEFSGGEWSQVTTTGTPPPAYYGSGMDYDAAIGAVVHFGGWQGGNNFNSTTSTFVGGAWTTASPTSSPTPRCCTALAYLPSLGADVLFSGQNLSIGTSPHPLSDTWLYQDGNWVRIHPVESPPVFGSSPQGVQNPMVYDAADGYLLLLAPNGTSTWTFTASPAHYTITTNEYTAAYEGDVPFGEISKISADWNVAPVTCQPDLAGPQIAATDLTMQGTGGAAFAVLQALCAQGATTPAYSAIALFPTGSGRVLALTVSAGDKIAATISFDSSTAKVKVAIDDLTTHQDASASRHASGFVPTFAGWVIGVGGVGLAEFSTPIKYTNAEVVDQGTTIRLSELSSLTELVMVDSSGYVLAQPSPLAASGTAFDVSWVAST